jgi:signal transduction histidine kinase
MAETVVRVLLVDDSPEDRAVSRHFLQQISEPTYTVVEAETGEDGLAWCQNDPPDCILLDYRLPDLSGLEFLAALAGEDGRVSLPVIMMTGEGNESLVAEAMKAGVADYLPKSVLSTKSLKRAIDSAIARFKLLCAIEAQQRLIVETNRELQQRNTEVQQFYHVLAHELKTPLTAAREFVSIVLDGLAGPLNETQQEYLSYAKESCNQMTLDLNDLLDSTRLDTGKLCIRPRPTAMEGIVARGVASMALQAQEKGIRLQQSIAQELPLVCIDEQRIAQVLTNLLSNALKFTPPGGEVVVRVGQDSPQQPGRVLVAVSDTGRGIEPEQIEHIFGRLFQVRRDDTAIEGGLGLGLYISREVVRLHGGEIWVESMPGKGSTFSFTVPAYNARHTSLVEDKQEIAQ